MTSKAKKKPATPNRQTPPEMLAIDDSYVMEGDKAKFAGKGGEAFSKALAARALAQPEVRAARVIQAHEGGNLDINACAEELRQQVAAVQSGGLARPEAMLVAQAHTLDALFSDLAMRSRKNSTAGYLDAADRYMRLALKAQAQSVRTIEALGELKNPKPVTFVRQANVANGPQQINNGTAAPSHAQETEFEQSKLSGGGNELLPDARASRLTIPANQEVEALGEIHRAEVGRG